MKFARRGLLSHRYLSALSLAAGLLPSISQAQLAHRLEYVPRIDQIQTWRSDTQAPDAYAQRFFLKGAWDTSGAIGPHPLRLRIEGFTERETTGRRETHDESDLQEAWFDTGFKNLSLRLGRQPIRWSQSWTLPSVDYFTGRRLHRLFIDPLPEQLTHPDAIRILYATSESEFELVRILRSSPTRQPAPLGRVDRRDDQQWGLRANAKFGAVNLSAMARTLEVATTTNSDARRNDAGLQASWSWDDFVLKSEMGAGQIESTDQSQFFIFGVDYFKGDWSFTPQITLWKDRSLTQNRDEQQIYFPIRWMKDKWSAEAEALHTIGKRDHYINLALTREFTSGLTLTALFQDYLGDPTRLLGIYERQTRGQLFGLRLNYQGGLEL
ncbi:MAG TPA: hypothetical protein PLZ57_10720 [Pseudobdellovibrionaceae bacterium]|nr:hypothetical protein [Pseudobdellovibrionaceae bacterium]